MTNLFERVAWERRDEQPDGYGNTTTGAWTEQFTSRASFTCLRGGEAVMAGRLQGRQPIVVRVRVSSNTKQIDADWQMRDTRTEVVYAVLSIIPTVDRAYIDITVQSGTAS